MQTAIHEPTCPTYIVFLLSNPHFFVLSRRTHKVTSPTLLVASGLRKNQCDTKRKNGYSKLGVHAFFVRCIPKSGYDTRTLSRRHARLWSWCCGCRIGQLWQFACQRRLFCTPIVQFKYPPSNPTVAPYLEYSVFHKSIAGTPPSLTKGLSGEVRENLSPLQ